MNMTTCTKCWSTPCICGEQFKHVSTDHLLLLMEELTKILNDRKEDVSTTVKQQPIHAYLLEKNHYISYDASSSLLTILQERKFILPEVYYTYIADHTTAGAVYMDLKWNTDVPYRAAFAIVLYTISLTYRDTALQQFFLDLLQNSTCLFDNTKLVSLLRSDVEHPVFQKNLYTATQQIQVILGENLKKVDPEWILAWSMLTRVESFYTGDLNVKFQAMKEITELISGNTPLTTDRVFMIVDPDLVDKIDRLNRRDYELYEMDDEDLVHQVMDEQHVRPPYFGMLKAK